MMRIRKSSGPETLTLDIGVTLTVRPNGSAVMEDARSDPMLVEERDATIEELGVKDASEIPVHRAGMLMNRAIARAAIIDWDSPVDAETDKPLKLSPEAINACMADDRFYRAFFADYILPAWQLETEKNG